MKRLAWHKLGLLLVCALIATGCDQNDNFGTENINWESVNLENLTASDLANQSLDELLEILNNLELFGDRITAIDDSCLNEIGNISNFLASNRTVTCQVQLENGEWVTILVNRDLWTEEAGNEEEPVEIDLPITFNPPNQNNDNPDSRDPITDPVDDNPDSRDPITDPVDDNPDSRDPITDPVDDNPDSRDPITDPVDDNPDSRDPITDNPGSGGGVIITDPPIPDGSVTVSESQSIASLGFFSILLFGQRTFKYFRRQHQAKKMPTESHQDR
jgi:hypothetical protein